MLSVITAIFCSGCDNDEDLFVPGVAKHIDETVVKAMVTGAISKSYVYASSETFVKDKNGKWDKPKHTADYPDGYLPLGSIKAPINIKDGKFWINNHNIYSDRYGGYLGSAWQTYEKEAKRETYGLPRTYTVYPFDPNDWSHIFGNVFPVRITDSEIVLCQEWGRPFYKYGVAYENARFIYTFKAAKHDFDPEPYHPVYDNMIDRDMNMINKMAEFYDEDTPIATYVREFAYDLGPEYVTLKQLREIYGK